MGDFSKFQQCRLGTLAPATCLGGVASAVPSRSSLSCCCWLRVGGVHASPWLVVCGKCCSDGLFVALVSLWCRVVSCYKKLMFAHVCASCSFRHSKNAKEKVFADTDARL